jgi:Pyruvate/2-oxoacid:ferredoxin oxidoreductase gamma subunit
MNITVLGVLIGLDVLPLDTDSVKTVIAEISPIHASWNMAAFEAGWNVGCEKRNAVKPAIRFEEKGGWFERGRKI